MTQGPKFVCQRTGTRLQHALITKAVTKTFTFLVCIARVCCCCV